MSYDPFASDTIVGPSPVEWAPSPPWRPRSSPYDPYRHSGDGFGSPTTLIITTEAGDPLITQAGDKLLT